MWRLMMKQNTEYLGNKIYRKCRICKQSGSGKFYKFITIFTHTTLEPVCRTCMMKEYYGTRTKRSRHWTGEDVFGIKDHK